MLYKRLNGGLLLAAVGCVAALIAPARSTAGNDGMTVTGKVTPVPAAGLVSRPGNFFDLEGKTVTFTPDGAGRYRVRTDALTWVETSARIVLGLRAPAVEPPGPFDDIHCHARVAAPSYGASAGVSLPFAFPFAGRTWTRVHANTNGNISFAAPEATHWEERDPWADGTMRSVAAAVDSRSAAELEAMIAVLWADYDESETTISVDSSPTRVAITWDAVARNFGSLGPNKFQVRLYPSGAIELGYRQVSERDGIVGLFHGADVRGRTLGTVEDVVGDAADAILDIVSFKLVDNGSTVIASVTMAADIPDRVSSGSIGYYVLFDLDGRNCGGGIDVDATGRREASWCSNAPDNVGFRVRGATLEIPISKTLLNDVRTVSWSMNAVWWGRDMWDALDGTLRTRPDEWSHDLSSMAQTVAGNVFEVFHYPSMTKDMREISSFVYAQEPDDDEIAVFFTDFRIDDLFGAGGGSGPINVPVKGLGDSQADPNPGSEFGSDSLLVTMSPTFVGGPNFRESGHDGDGRDRNHAIAVFWVVHEAVHRWAAHLRFRNPQTGRIESLTGDGCHCHWSNWMHAPVVHPVWREFADRPYPEASIMGGALWLENGDGTFTWQGAGSWKAAGLSNLDLYVMGLIPPEEVGPSFILRDPVETGTWGVVRASKVPVRIEDIVAAMGPRVPSAAEQRRDFRMGIYLLHDGRAPRTDLLARTRNINDRVVKYFTLATGGRAEPGAGDGDPPDTGDPPEDGDAGGVCAPDEETLCLGDSRYRVRARWHTADGAQGQAGVASARTDDAGLFWFFGQENWEVLIKVLDGCAVNDHVWVFGASTTDLGYTIDVTDTMTGAVKVYRNDPGRPAPAITDSEAFPGSCGASAGVAAAVTAAAVEPPAAPPPLISPDELASSQAQSAVVQPANGGCVSDEWTLCLQEGRYRVNVGWRSAPEGDYSPARRAEVGTRDSGLYSFFDAKNWEMLIKVLDGCAVNDQHWVFAASATDLGFRIEVTDTETDESWTHTKQPGQAAEAVTDSGAFPEACRR